MLVSIFFFFSSLGFGPSSPHPPLSPSVSVKLKPIVAQATGMNVTVTPLLFSLSIKSKMAQTQFTARMSGTPPLYLLPDSCIKPAAILGLIMWIS